MTPVLLLRCHSLGIIVAPDGIVAEVKSNSSIINDGSSLYSVVVIAAVVVVVVVVEVKVVVVVYFNDRSTWSKKMY